jgi:hypothetical protein
VKPACAARPRKHACAALRLCISKARGPMGLTMGNGALLYDVLYPATLLLPAVCAPELVSAVGAFR